MNDCPYIYRYSHAHVGVVAVPGLLETLRCNLNTLSTSFALRVIMVFIGHFEFLVGDQKMSSAWL